ncbi:MAG: hypothetical protein QOH57_5315 [Mycobacterium sp.]|jgi:hypothetical protein|nr:hypothetical protein [Mycobacterium sp.]
MRSLLLLVLAMALAISATTTPAARATVLTPQDSPYWMLAVGARIFVYNAESGTDNREIYFNRDLPDSPEAMQCATWTEGSGIAQNGLAFRIEERSDGYNAIVFPRNIFAFWYWIFAPKMFHTGSDYVDDWGGPQGVDLGDYLGRDRDTDVYPLRICASLDSSNVLRFAVAKGTDPLPPLTDPGIQGGSWTLNMSEYYHDGEGLTGKNGGTFAAHLPIGTSLTVDDTTLDGLPAPLPN